jgi:hypothetical protein
MLDDARLDGLEKIISNSLNEDAVPQKVRIGLLTWILSE